MADNSILKTTGHMVTEKKLNGWGNEKNFAGAEELTVTITLDEYRDLLVGVAQSKVDKATSEFVRVKGELKKAVEENNELEETIEKLRVKIAKLETEIANARVERYKND